MKPEDFPVSIHEDEDRLAVVGPTWAFNPKFTFQDFLKAHAKNPHAALRDFASSPQVAAEKKLYHDVPLLRSRASRRAHPVQDDLTLLPSFRPRLADYYVHLDLSESKDSTALAMVHYNSEKPEVSVDILLVIRPEGQKIDYPTIERFILHVQDLGFHLAQVSTDRFQSYQLRKSLEDRGVKTAIVSPDRTPEAQETLYTLFHSGAIDTYDYPPLWDNLEDLVIKDSGKIDHRPLGAKDLADALACATLSCLKLSGKGVPDIEPLQAPDETDAAYGKRLDAALKETENLEDLFDVDDPALDKDDDGEAF